MGSTLTLSVDPKSVERAREAARHQGKSLNAMLREYIDQLAGRKPGAEVARELQRMWRQEPGHSGGWKFNREEIYEERLNRYGKTRG
jgi:hypothetical protein